MRSLFLYLIIVAIWVVINIVKNNMKQNAKKSKTDSRQNNNTMPEVENEEEIFKYLKKEINNRNVENNEEEEVYVKEYDNGEEDDYIEEYSKGEDMVTSSTEEHYKEHSIHNGEDSQMETPKIFSNAEEEMLALQKKYEEKMNTLNTVNRSVAVAVTRSESSDSLYNMETAKMYANYDNNIATKLASVDIKNAIVYKAILEPKRMQYKKIAKNLDKVSKVK